MNGLRQSLAVLVGVIGFIQGLHAQDSTSAAVTNLRLYQSLASSLGDTLAIHLPEADSPRVSVKIAPGDVAWFLQDGVERAFRAKHCIISISDTAEFGAEFGALEMHVRYSNLHRTGFLGSQVLDRSVVLLARLRLTDRRREAVLMTGERRAEYSDTIELSQIEGMEHTAIPSTRGQIPSEDFFSGVIEPLVIIGAVAVAIFLLFTVRS